MKAAEKNKNGHRTRLRPLAKQVGAPSPSVAPATSGIQLKKVLVPIDFSEPSLKALGSTTERVVQHAHCPVLVVRRKANDFIQSDQPSTQKELL
jgi:hypothetical protein